jgi:hypothetical protein
MAEAISSELARRLQGAHRAVVDVQAWGGGTGLLDLTPDTQLDAPGSIDMDDVGGVQLRGLALAPTPAVVAQLGPGGLLDPRARGGRDIRVQRGAQLPDGSVELVPVPVLRITKVRRGTDGQVVVDADDYGREVLDKARVTEPHVVTAGTLLVDATQRLLSEGLPRLEYRLPDLADTVPHMIVEEQKGRWEVARGWWRERGWILEWSRQDPTPTVTARQVPLLAEQEPAWSFDEADERPLISSASEDVSTDRLYNWVVVTGERADGTPPVRGEALLPGARDEPRPLWQASEVLTTAEQCSLAAQTRLATEQRVTREAAIVGLCAPHLAPWDVIRAGAADAGVSGLRVIGSYKWGLGDAYASMVAYDVVNLGETYDA